MFFNSAEKEHTNHNNHSHTHHKNDNFDLDSKDPSNNTSYDEKGVMKISNDIIVPDYLVSLLIGKSGETIRSIMNKSGSMITFQKEVRKIKIIILSIMMSLKSTQLLEYLAESAI